MILGALRAINDNGDAALPVHDALIVPTRCVNQAVAKMVESFERKCRCVNPCSVSIKGRSVLYMGETAFPPPLSALVGRRAGASAPW